MLREREYVLKNISIIIDFFLALGAFIGAHYVRNLILAPYFFPNFLLPSKFSHYYSLFLIFPVASVIILSLNGFYRPQRGIRFGNVIRIVTVSCVEILVAIAFLMYLLKRGDTVSRGQIILAPTLFWLFLLTKSEIMRLVMARLRREGRHCVSVLLVGSGQRLESFIHHLESHPLWGFKIEGIVTDDPNVKIGASVSSYPVVELLSRTIEYLEQHTVDEIIFIPGHASINEIVPLLEGCEIMGIRTRISLQFFEHTIARPELSQFQEISMITYDPTAEMNLQLFIKYTFDRIMALILLILFSPVMIATALAIKLTSQKGAPILFRQVRCGLNGKPFTLYKFRSMKVGAHEEVEKLRQKSDVDGPVFKMKKDPRVTQVGRFIRKTSIDELPQLFNVLFGDMSLVGPRPPIPEEVANYDRWQRRRLSMKPGITCLWQVMGRNKLSFDTWMKLDLEYIDNWSLILDLKILFRTVFVVTTGYGAM